MLREPPLVVVVDDEVSICRALVRLLRSADLRADSYCSAQAFLDGLPGRMPDCLVLDLQMPEMTGLELQARLQLLDDPPPIVVMTAFDQAGAREHCFNLGAVSFLRKPVEGDLLLKSVRDAISGAAT